MRVRLLFAAGFVVFAQGALAGMNTDALTAVAVDPPSGARIPMQDVWVNEQGVRMTLADAIAGRPTLLIFADFNCTTLCGPVLSVAAAALAQSTLKPFEDYRMVVLGLDPKDPAAEARRMRAQQIGASSISAVVTFLRAGQAEIGRAAAAVGYRFTYDAEHDQFAHPAALVVLAPDGRVSRVLSGLGLTDIDLTLALVEAGRGRTGALSQRVQLLCYGFDPALGVYTLSVYRALALACGLTVVLLAGGIAVLSLRSAHRS